METAHSAVFAAKMMVLLNEQSWCRLR